MRIGTSLAMAGALCLGAAAIWAEGDATMPEGLVEKAVKVAFVGKGGGVVVTVDGQVREQEALVGALRESVRELARELAGRRARLVCEIRMPGNMGYGHLAAAIEAAEKAGMPRQRLTIDGEAGLEHNEPAILNRSGGPGWTVMWIRMTRRGDGTIVSAFGGATVTMDQAGSEGGNAEILRQMEAKAKGMRERVQVMIGPAADVPCRDVLAVYALGQKAGIKRVGFAPGLELAPAGTMPVDAAAATQEDARAVKHEKVVYVVDLSAATAGQADHMKREIVEDVDRAKWSQGDVDAVLLGSKSEAIFGKLQRVTPAVGKAFEEAIAKRKAEGDISGKLEPFKAGFEKAFAERPDVICFVTAATFDPELLKVVAGLNKDHSVEVMTLGAGPADVKRDGLLKEMAKANNGFYKPAP